jgi:DNA-binding response OmpR family regulator
VKSQSALTAASATSNRLIGVDFDPGSNVVDVYVGYLRKKLGKGRIVNVRGMGYKLDVEAPRDGPRRQQ